MASMTLVCRNLFPDLILTRPSHVVTALFPTLTRRERGVGSRKCTESSGKQALRNWSVFVPRVNLNAAKDPRCSWPQSATTEILRSPRLPFNELHPIRVAYCGAQGFFWNQVAIRRLGASCEGDDVVVSAARSHEVALVV